MLTPERRGVIRALNQLDRAGGRLARLAVMAYERARRELLGQILEKQDQSVTAMSMRMVLIQVEARLGQLYRDVSRDFGEHIASQARRESEEAIRDLREIVPHKVPVGYWKPIVPHDAVNQIIENGCERIKAVNEDLRLNIKMELTNSMIKGESIHKAAKGILSNTDLTTEGIRPVFPTAQVRAEVIARTEISKAANASHLATYLEMKKQLPGLKVRWSSALCRTTCKKCQGMNNELREPGEEFSAGVSAPPLHPRCLCRLVASVNKDIPTFGNPNSDPAKVEAAKKAYEEMPKVSFEPNPNLPKVAKPAPAPKPKTFREFEDGEDGKVWQEKHFKHWESSLSDKERKAMDAYQGQGYQMINTLLRGGNKYYNDKNEFAVNFTKENVPLIDAALAKAPLKEGVKVYRGFDMPELVENWDNIIGTEIGDKAYTSTTHSMDMAMNYARGNDNGIMATIHVPEGINAAPMAIRDHTNQDEYELLLERGLKFRVTGARQVGNFRMIDMEAFRDE